MPTVNLTDRKLRSLVSKDQRTDFYDKSLSCFGVRVTPTGRKSFILRYRNADGRERRMTLGKYPALSLADARDRARIILAEVARGMDPAGIAAARRRAPTFRELADEYLERYAKPRKRSWDYDRRMIEYNLLEPWGERKARDIDRFDVMRLLDVIVDRGATQQATRVRALISKVFAFGITRGHVNVNPVAGVPRPITYHARERVLTTDELRRFWSALDDETPVMAAHFKMRLLTAQRGIEVLSMHHDDIDDDWWTIPVGVSKNKASHRVPLSAQSLEVLESVALFNAEHEWVFPSPSRRGHLRWVNKAGREIAERAGIEDFRPHDLRRTAATYIASMGTPRTVVGKILNHAEPGVTAVYDRSSYDAEKRQALVAWGDRVEQIVTGKTAEEKVVGRIG